MLRERIRWWAMGYPKWRGAPPALAFGPFRKIVTAITAAPNACWQTDHAKLLRRGTTWSVPTSIPSRLSDALTSPSHVPLPRYPTHS